MTNEAQAGYVDSARKCDIDFETMRRQNEEEAAKRYDKIIIAIKDLPKPETWENVRNRMDGDIKGAREFYNEQAAVKAFHKAIDSAFADIEDYLVERDEYLKRARNNAISTYAMIYKGKWYGKGEMGWFGCSHDEIEESEWLEKFNELIDSVSDDTLLSVYDCHI